MLKKSTYTILLIFVSSILFFPGSIAGDFEKVYSISKVILDFNLSIFEFNHSDGAKINELTNEGGFRRIDSFINRNYLFIISIAFILKFISFINSFLGVAPNELKFITEMIISYIPTFLFFLSIYLIFKTYEKKFESKYILLTIFFFFFCSYLINYMSSHFFAEIFIFFLISLRVYLKSKNTSLIILAIIDFFLIQTRITCIVIVAYFIIEAFLEKKLNLKKIFIFIIFLSTLSYFFGLISYQTGDSGVIVGRIMKSICFFDDSFYIFYQYLYKIYLSFFSLTLGIFFTFPAFVIFILILIKQYNNKLIILKFLTIGAIISLFALEEYWFLPAGISGHRGIGPFLIILFPNILQFIVENKHRIRKLTFVFIGLLYLLNLPSLNYRTTLAFYSQCGNIDTICNNFFSKFVNELDHLYYNSNSYNDTGLTCRHPNLFTNTDIRMHPGVFGWRVIVAKTMNKEYVNVIYKKTDGLDPRYNSILSENKNYSKGYFKQKIVHFVPQTLISRINYILNTEIEFDQRSDKKIMKNFHKSSEVLKFIAKFLNIFVYLFYAFFPIYYFLRKFKTI